MVTYVSSQMIRHSISREAQQDLEIDSYVESNIILQWFRENLLCVNSNKTKLLDLSIDNKNTFPLHFFIGEGIVTVEEEVKCLALLDSKLNYYSQIEYFVKH